jgi:Holliday junction resolvasome RuvABC endonuclease subunit
MPINIYSVRNHLEEEGWKLVSDTYKNLDTELEMICPKGHKQTQTYKQWRKHPICEVCMAGDPFKGKKNSVPTKTIDTYRILALDAATNVTGYSVYDNGALVAFGTYKTNDKNDVTERINEMKHWLEQMIDVVKPDYIGIENVQLQGYGNGQQVELYRKLANLQGGLVDTCFEHNLPWGLVYATQWRKYCGVGEGTGRENKKKQAQDKVKLWYEQDCTQDEADAICIGKYFVGQINNKKSSWGENFD